MRFDISSGCVGRVHGPYPPAKNQNLIRWTWEANGYEHTRLIAEYLWPYLGAVKREQFQHVLKTHLETRGGVANLRGW